MAIPTYDKFVDPLLRLLARNPDGVHTQPAYQELATQIGLTAEEMQKRLPSGLQPVYQNRIGWAHDRLKRAGASSSPRHGLWRITAAGQKFLARYSDKPFALEDLQREFSLVGGDIPDPTIRIGTLPSAVRAPVTVNRDTSVREAVTQMLLRDYSQLPVVHGERTILGVVSWKSIGRAQLLGRSVEWVRECMDEHIDKVADDADLFQVLEKIIANDFVLVVDKESRVSGIVTVSDVSQQFREMSEPYLLLGSIENQIRRLIAGKFPLETLKAVRKPGDDRAIAGLFDLSFGEYVALLGNETNWKRLNLAIDRKTFVNALERVREIRNAVMHFDPDLEYESVHELRDVARLLEAVVPRA
jgi:CBS domain-containing protein